MKPLRLVLLQYREECIPGPCANFKNSIRPGFRRAGFSQQREFLTKPLSVFEEVDIVVCVELVPEFVRVGMEALFVKGGDGVGFLCLDLGGHVAEVFRVGGGVVPGVVVPGIVFRGEEPLAECEGGGFLWVCRGAVAGFEGGARGGGEGS